MLDWILNTILHIHTQKTLVLHDSTLCVPTLQNSQTHSNNSSAKSRRIVCVFDHFLGLVLKGLIFFHEKIYKLSLTQKRIQNPVKCLRWSKYLVADENA